MLKRKRTINIVRNRSNFWTNNSQHFFCSEIATMAQQCWIRLHSSSNIVGATLAHYTWPPKYWRVVSFPRSTSGPNIDMPTSRPQIFSRARSASGRFFMFSAAKARERARERELDLVDFLCFLRQKRARAGGQLPEPEMRSEGLWGSVVPTLLGVVASVCTPLPNYWPNNLVSCCVRLHVASDCKSNIFVRDVWISRGYESFR